VAGGAAASIVFQDEKLVAFMTTRPLTVGHTLVVTRKHCTSLGDLDEAIGDHLFRTTLQVARAIRKSGLRCEGINLMLNDGEPLQKILHLHMHVFPRFRGDKFKLERDQVLRQTRDDLDATARIIRDAF
jgi:histidine triad (HIT) family protein